MGKNAEVAVNPWEDDVPVHLGDMSWLQRKAFLEIDRVGFMSFALHDGVCTGPKCCSISQQLVLVVRAWNMDQGPGLIKASGICQGRGPCIIGYHCVNIEPRRMVYTATPPCNAMALTGRCANLALRCSSSIGEEVVTDREWRHTTKRILLFNYNVGVLVTYVERVSRSHLFRGYKRCFHDASMRRISLIFVPEHRVG